MVLRGLAGSTLRLWKGILRLAAVRALLVLQRGGAVGSLNNLLAAAALVDILFGCIVLSSRRLLSLFHLTDNIS